MKQRNFLLVSLLTLGLVTSSFAVVSPSSVKIKVYGVSVSLRADCSSPISIFSSASGTEVDFVTAPTLGTGNLADGSYQCVMITMSDNIKATPAATEGACRAGEETSGGVCRNESAETLDGTTFTTSTCTNAEEKVTLFLHTGTTRVNGGNAFRKPDTTSDTAKGFKLAGAFTVSGSATGTFVADFTNKMESGGGECGLNPPLFGFR